MLFNYKAIDNSGENKEGTVEAVNIDVAINSIQKRGLIISAIITLLATAFVVYQFVHVLKLDRIDKKKDDK